MLTGAYQARIAGSLALAVLLAAPAGAVAATGGSADDSWPCVQRLVPEIAAGVIWTGPPLDQVTVPEDEQLGQLATDLAARRVPIEDAAKRVQGYAQTLPPAERTARLSALFKRALAIVNQDRSSLIGGIRKFAQGQAALADKINASNQRIQSLGADRLTERETMMAERDWDVRIFDDRRSSLSYLCEQPVLLEQRAGALARMIAGQLEATP